MADTKSTPGLATLLLKGPVTFSYKIDIKSNSNLLWLKKCVKLVKNVINSDSECLGTCFSEKIIQIALILVKISDFKSDNFDILFTFPPTEISRFSRKKTFL